jgi:AcrR family transcriptional regulator
MIAMPRPVKTRPYDSTRRREKALENRAAILEAARRLFVADGYARTSIAAVATEAGVSPDLVYRHFGNKKGLVVELLNYAVTGELDSPKVLEQERVRTVLAEPDQRRQLAMFAADIAGRVARAQPIDDVIRSAGEVDREVAEMHVKMHRTRLRNLRRVVEAVASHGPLREGLDVDAAAATVWMLAGPATRRQLVEGLGWTQAHYADWLHDAVVNYLLGPERR